jgi:putative transposase
MSKSKHTEAQMIAALKQLEAGRRAEDVVREPGVSKRTIYAWKAKYGGMDVSEAQETRQLRDENTRLRKLVADLSLDKEALQSEIRKRLELAAMDAFVEDIQQQFAFSQRRARGLLRVAVLSFRYQSRRSGEDLRAPLVELAREKPRFGCRRLQVLLRRSGELVNHKRVHRVYREAGLTLKAEEA